MKKRNPIYTAGSFLLAGALTLSMAACSGAQAPAEATQTPSATATPAAAAAPAEETTPSAPESDALPVKALQPKQVEENPYMAKSDANIHHDGYNTDSTDEILPLGIYPEIHVSYETTNPNAPPAIYFDSYGHAVVPLLGGIAIRDLNAEETKTLGYFSPKQHDGGSYLIQSSYTFLDAENRIVCPTSNNHVLMLRATDEEGNAYHLPLEIRHDCAVRLRGVRVREQPLPCRQRRDHPESAAAAGRTVALPGGLRVL